MIKGNTVIFNDEYISEIERHITNTEKQLNNEISLEKRAALQEKLNTLNIKLEQSLDFQDSVEEILNVDTPRLTAVKTLSGMVLPARIVKVI